MDEIEQEIKFESKQRLENEKEVRANLENVSNKLKIYTDEAVEASRQLINVRLWTPIF